MSSRAKSAILIVSTLIIGVIIGALSHARLTDQRFGRLADLRGQRGLSRMIERTIEFESAEQKEQALKVVDQSSIELFQNMQRSHREMEVILERTREELAEILTSEQMEQLEKRLTRRAHRGRRGMRDGRRPPPPPPEQ